MSVATMWIAFGLVVAALAFWFALSVLNQMDRTRKWANPVMGYDVLGMVPAWTFFAPNPGDTDVHLLYRDADRHGNLGPWRLHALDPDRHLWTLWLPNRRIGKAVSDVSFRATRPDWDSKRGEYGYPLHPSRVLSFPYLFLLNLVADDPRHAESVSRQFALARTLGPHHLDDPEVVLVSAFHDLARD